MPDTLLSLVQEKLDEHPDHVAAVFDDGNEERQLTYAQLWNLSAKVGSALEATGCRNQVVGLCLQTDERMPAVLLGVLQCGASFYNMMPEAGEFTCKVLKELHIQVLIIHHLYIQVVLEESIERIDGLVRQIKIDGLVDYVLVVLEGSRQKYHRGNLAYCITTSGTTGIPKVVRVPNSCIVPNIIHLRKIYSLTSGDCVFLASPLTFDPSIVEIFSCLSVGACLLIVPPSVKMLPDRLLGILYHRHPVSVIQATPTLLLRFNKAKMPLTLLGDKSVLRVLALGGEPFPACSVIRKLRSPGNKTTFYNLYGTTEVSSWAMCYRVTEEDLRGDRDISLGDPLMGTTIQVLDPTGAEVTEGTGMLYIGGTERQCIIGKEEVDIYNTNKLVARATGDVVRREPGVARATGDVARPETGATLYYLGREDYQVKRNGKRLDLEEISQVAGRHSAVRSCAALHIAPSVVLFVVLQPQMSTDHNQPRSTNHDQSQFIDYEQTLSANQDLSWSTDYKDNGWSGSSEVPAILESIRRFLTDSLPVHCLPDDIMDVSEVTMTTHGKLDRGHLEHVYRMRSGCCPSVTMVTQLVQQQWKMLCTSRGIPEDSNFITAGGNSLKAVHLLTMLQDSMNRELPGLLDVLVNKTYGDVIAYLEGVFTDTASINNESEWSVDTLKTDGRDKIISKPSVEMFDRKTKGVHTNLRTVDTDFVIKLEEIENHVKTELLDTNVKSEMIDTMKPAVIDTSNIKPEVITTNVKRAEIHNNIKLREIDTTDTCMGINNSDHSLKHLKDIREIECSIVPIFGENQNETDDNKGEELQLSVRKKQKIDSLCTGVSDTGDIKDAGDKHHFIKSVGRGNKVMNTCKQELGYLTAGMGDKQETREMGDVSDIDIEVVAGGFRDEVDNTDGSIDDRCTNVTDEGMEDEMDIHLDEVWKHNTGKCVDASPMLAISRCKDGVVYIGSHSHNFAALTLFTGECIWEITLPDRIESSAGLSFTGRFVVVGCYDGCVYILHSGTGDIWWSFWTGSEVKSSPAVDMATGHVYVGSHSQSVYCLDVQGRTVIWEKCLNSGSIFASPTLCYDPHVVLVATLQGKLFALSAAIGDTLWMYDCKMPLFSSPTTTHSGVYIGCTDHALYHLSVHGKLVWKYTTTGPIFSSPAIGNINGTFSSTRASASEEYANAVGRSLHCQVAVEVSSKKHDNDVLTEYPSSSRTKQSTNPIVVFGSHDSCLYCPSSAGDLIWKVKVESPVYSTPFLVTVPVHMVQSKQDYCKVKSDVVSRDNFPSANVSNNDFPTADAQKCFKLKVDQENLKCNVLSLVVFASTVGTLYIVNSVTGRIVCKHKLLGEVFSSPIVYGKYIVVGCRDDFVYCYRMLPKTRSVPN